MPQLSSTVTVFQSSPVPKDGRYKNGDALPDDDNWFQSSPVPKDGRYRGVESGIVGHDRFNPRPSRRTGATQAARSLTGSVDSFNPRPSRRTGATRRALQGNALVLRFNPRPSRRTGATETGRRTGDVDRVSILARPEGRALPRKIKQHFCGIDVSILARPEGRALRRPTTPLQPMARGFNPRPSRRTGATVLESLARDGIVVSILARPEGRALHSGGVPSGTALAFQSSPVPKDGRYPPHIVENGIVLCFNPRPSRRTGATIPMPR